MLTKENLYIQNTMPAWSQISLKLYKEFSTECLFHKVFRYYLENNTVIDVVFKEWAMKHLWAIHHIDSRIDKDELFDKIDKGLTFADFTDTPAKRRRLNDYKDRIRMFACIYYILENGDIFYIEEGKLQGTEIRIDYLKSKIISGKGVNIGLRLVDNEYVPLTMLIDRAVNPTKTVERLKALKVEKMEIIENGEIIKTVTYSGKIFYVMGKSASGKDTVYKELRDRFPELKTVVLYTTRPIRDGETEGVEYHFTTAERLNDFRREKRLIEERTYQTAHGPWSYFTVDDGQICLDKNDFYLMIGTLESYEKMREYFGENGLVPVYIEVDDGVRLERALEREKRQKEPKYKELCRRFLADEEDFKEENLARCGIRRRYKNDELEVCLEEICRDMKAVMGSEIGSRG